MPENYESIIKVGAEIARNLTPDALKAAKALRDLARDTKALKQAEAAAKAHKKLSDAVTASKAKYDQAAAALRKLEDAEKAAGGATKESTKWRQAGQRVLASAAREMDRATKAAENNARALRALGVDTRRLAHEQAKLQAAGRFAAARKNLIGDPREKGPLLGQARSQFGTVARDAALLGGVAVGAGAGLAHLALGTLKVADEIGDTSEKLKIGTDALQELRYGAKQAGDETGYIDKALGKMLITVGKFKSAKGAGGKSGGGGAIPGLELLDTGSAGGGAPSQDPFKRLGLNAKALASLKPEDQLKKIADAMLKLKTQADRAAVGTAIFGKGFKEIDPFMKGGSADIEKAGTKAHEAMAVLSASTIKAADEADKAMKDAEAAFHGVTNTLGAALLPTATKVFKEFSAWVAANRGEIQQWAQNVARWIDTTGVPALKSLAGGVASTVGEMVKLGKWLNEHVPGGLKTVAISIAALRLAPLATTLGKIALEAGKAAAAMLRFAAANSAAGGGGGAPGAAGGGGFGLAKALPFVGLAVAGGEFLSNQEMPGGGGLTVGDFANPGAFTQDKAQQFLLSKLRAQGGGAGGAAHFDIRPQLTFGGAPLREDLANGMDQAKQRVLEDYDRKRLSFGE